MDMGDYYCIISKQKLVMKSKKKFTDDSTVQSKGYKRGHKWVWCGRYTVPFWT
jgi:hypothetical protein